MLIELLVSSIWTLALHSITDEAGVVESSGREKECSLETDV